MIEKEGRLSELYAAGQPPIEKVPQIIHFSVGPEKIRLLGSTKTGNIRQMTTPEAEAFFTLYEGQIKDVLDSALRHFVRSKV